jgi:hypothetical protein
MELESGKKMSKKTLVAGDESAQHRLAEAGLVLDFSIDGDLRNLVLSGEMGLQAAAITF